MNKEEIICQSCEAEFYIEHDQEVLNCCPFCGDQLLIEDEIEIEEDFE